MHPDARTFISSITNPQVRADLETFFDAYDAMDRENVHLRLLAQKNGACPYDNFQATGCKLGYPGCLCMDNILAMQGWTPADEIRPPVRLGLLLAITNRLLCDCQDALLNAADVLEMHGARATADAARKLAMARVQGPMPSDLRWATRQRMEFIHKRLEEAGRINRADLIAKFQISAPTAAKDFATFRDLFPGVMKYSVSLKAYVPAATPRPYRKPDP